MLIQSRYGKLRGISTSGSSGRGGREKVGDEGG